MPISRKQKNKIRELMHDHFNAFLVEVLGPEAIATTELRHLQQANILPPTEDAVSQTQVAFAAAHVVGKTGRQLARMTPAAFWKFLEATPPQFSAAEIEAIDGTRARIATLVEKMRDDLVHDFDDAVHEETAKLRHEALLTLQHEAALGIARRQSKEQITRRIRRRVDATQARWALTVATELHDAQERARALAMAHEEDKDPLVYKLTQPTACVYCKMLYLVGNRPRIFRLSDLVRNGTNNGRKAVKPDKSTEWRPVVGVVHPGCQCELHKLPAGMVFDDEGRLVPAIRKAIADEFTVEISNLANHECS